MTDIPQEWVDLAADAYDAAADPGNYLDMGGIEAALTAVIPLVRADAERERDRYREALEAIEDRLLLNGGCFARRLVQMTRQALEGEA